MATDWAADVKKYDAKADSATIAGIVRYCGIALRNRDSALVSFSDKAETDRVRTNFLKKKLALTQADSVLDAAIAKVGEAMKADRTKNRVTVYYLLASEFKQLGLHKLDVDELIPLRFDAAQNLAGKVAGHAVRLDQDECFFGAHRAPNCWVTRAGRWGMWDCRAGMSPSGGRDADR